jgi:hypothetical protein
MRRPGCPRDPYKEGDAVARSGNNFAPENKKKHRVLIQKNGAFDRLRSGSDIVNDLLEISNRRVRKLLPGFYRPAFNMPFSLPISGF